MPRWTPNIASPKLWVRGIVAAGVVALLLVWTGVLSWLSDLPAGYGAAQSRNQKWLKEHATEWSSLRRGTSHDLLRYIPGYLVFGVLLTVAAVLSRRRGAVGLSASGDRVPALVALSALAIGAIADVVETLLFRRSLTRLIDTSGGADVSTLTSITRLMTGLKWTALSASFVTILVLVLRPPQAD